MVRNIHRPNAPLQYSDAAKLRDLHPQRQLLPEFLSFMTDTNERAVIGFMAEHWQQYFYRYRQVFLAVWVQFFLNEGWRNQRVYWDLFARTIGPCVYHIAHYGYLLVDVLDYEQTIYQHARILIAESPAFMWAELLQGPGSGGTCLWQLWIDTGDDEYDEKGIVTFRTNADLQIEPADWENRALKDYVLRNTPRMQMAHTHLFKGLKP